MDRFSAISLFDFFSFLVPGFLLGAALYICYRLSGITLLYNFPLIFEKEAILFILVSIVAYLAGHAVHYISHQLEWFGAGNIKGTITSYFFLNTDPFLSDKLNEYCKQEYDYPLLDANGKALPDEADRFFETSFRILENNGLLQTSRTLQIQFFLFVNVYTVFLLASISGIATIVYVIFATGDRQAIKHLLFLSILSALLGSFCYSIACSRRKQFIKTIWWQFYTFYCHQSIKP